VLKEATSGAMKYGVPTTLTFLLLIVDSWLAIPKSATRIISVRSPKKKKKKKRGRGEGRRGT
jgi:hypothetical protein